MRIPSCDVSFSMKLAPGIRIRASSRGIRTSGRAGDGPGSSPGAAAFYAALRGGHSPAGRSYGSLSTVSFQRQMVAHGRLTMAEKAHRARLLVDSFLRIADLHRVEFAPAAHPAALPPRPPDRAAIYKHYEHQALAGVSVFNRRGRKEARQRASAWAEGEMQRQWAEASQQHAQAQARFDERWAQLNSNVPAVVMETLDEAFKDNEVPSAAVGVDGAEVALVVLVPDLDLVVPDQMPTTTAAVNLSLK
jgi:hypothetical protein